MPTTTLSTATPAASTIPTTTNETMETTLNPTTISEVSSTVSMNTAVDELSSVSTTPDLTTTQTATSTEAVPSPDGPMPLPSLVAIIAGSIVGIFILILIGVLLYRRRKRKRSRPRERPVLPSSEDLDPFKFVTNAPSKDNMAENEPTELYINIEKGKPSENTNPNVGEDGYLKKTGAGVSYSNEEQVKKKNEGKKIKNKFKKKHKKRAEHNDAFSPAPESHDLGDCSRDDQIGSTVSDIGYLQGRAAEVGPIGAGNASDVNGGHYANLPTNKEQEDYYNVNTGLYENTGRNS